MRRLTAYSSLDHMGLLVFEGSWTVFPRATLVCLVASDFTAVYAVRLFNRVGFGRLDNARADWQGTSLWPLGLTGWSETATAALTLSTQLPV